MEHWLRQVEEEVALSKSGKNWPITVITRGASKHEAVRAFMQAPQGIMHNVLTSCVDLHDLATHLRELFIATNHRSIQQTAYD